MLSHTNAQWKWNKTHLSQYAEKMLSLVPKQDVFDCLLGSIPQDDLDLSTQNNMYKGYINTQHWFKYARNQTCAVRVEHFQHVF